MVARFSLHLESVVEDAVVNRKAKALQDEGLVAAETVGAYENRLLGTAHNRWSELEVERTLTAGGA